MALDLFGTIALLDGAPCRVKTENGSKKGLLYVQENMQWSQPVSGAWCGLLRADPSSNYAYLEFVFM